MFGLRSPVFIFIQLIFERHAVPSPNYRRTAQRAQQSAEKDKQPTETNYKSDER